MGRLIPFLPSVGHIAGVMPFVIDERKMKSARKRLTKCGMNDSSSACHSSGMEGSLNARDFGRRIAFEVASEGCASLMYWECNCKTEE